MPRDTPHRIEHPLILYPAPLELFDHHPLARVFKIDRHRENIIQKHPPTLKAPVFNTKGPSDTSPLRVCPNPSPVFSRERRPFLPTSPVISRERRPRREATRR